MSRRAHPLRLLACLLMVLLLAVQLTPALAVSGSTSLAQAGDRYVVIASGLNLRSGPGVSYGRTAVLRRGTVVTYISRTNGWWRVRSSDGLTGYVDRQFLTKETATNTGTYYVTASTLLVRKEPKTTSSRVGKLSKGTSVTISQLNGDWGYVSSGSVRGWVALKYLSTSANATSKGSGVYVVTASALNVRSSASASSSRIGTLKRGTQVRVIQTSGSWGKITFSKSGKMVDGWVSLSYLRAQ